MGPVGWTLVVLGLLAGAISLATLIGALLPREHVASRRLNLAQSSQSVFDVLNDPLHYPEWWSLLKSVDALPDREGKRVVRVTYNDGNRFQLVFDEVASPTRLVVRIDDESKFFQGTWTYDIAPTEKACQITLTEHGEIPNPLIRLMARMMMNPTMYIDLHLNALAGKFGEKATSE
jgi:uncharacterized protein YndB with AHSA1/START domain